MNPVYGPVILGLLLVLIIESIGPNQFLYANECVSAIGVGTFIGMVSYQYINSYIALVFVGILGGFVQLAISPIFSGGFGGLEGVCAAIACLMYLFLRYFLRKCCSRNLLHKTRMASSKASEKE